MSTELYGYHKSLITNCILIPHR